MGIQESVEQAKNEMRPIAEKIMDLEYTAEDFRMILSNLIAEEMERQEAD